MSAGIAHSVFVVSETGTVNVIATVLGCGDGNIQSGEECDGSNLAGQSCTSKGFSGGFLSCTASCTFNISTCTSAPPPPPQPPPGGGMVYFTPQTTVNFSGRAYPRSVVTILKDAQIAATTVAGTDANFQVTVSGLSSGNYIFSIYAEDNNGNRSSLLSFPLSVTSGDSANVSGIFIAPTIAVDKSEVKQGESIAIFGTSAPNSEITILVNSEKEFFSKVKADKEGVYLYNFDTTPLTIGQHHAKSKSAIGGAISSFSKTVGFAVGTKTVLVQPKTAPAKGDLNGDKKVNLVDFSIFAYWYKRPSPPASVDLNGDGRIDLVDFSIMAFYWTG